MANEKLEQVLQELQGLSDEEFEQRLVALASGEQEKHEPEPARKVTFRLPDGSVIEGNSVEDVQRIVNARAQQSPNPPPPGLTPSEQVKWDYDQFVERFKKDPREGLDYADQSQFGVPIRQLVPVLAVGMSNLMKEVQDLRQREIARQIPQDAIPVVNQLMQELGMPGTPQAYDAALTLAQAKGLIAGPQQQTAAPVPPPRVPRGSAESVASDSQLAQMVDGLDDEALERLVMARGLITKSHLS